MGLQRKQQAQSVSDNQQYGQSDAKLLGQSGARQQVSFGDRRRTDECNRSEKEQSRVQTGAGAIVLLEMVLEAPEEKGCAEHKKRVGHDGAGYRAFHQRILSRAERSRCNDQFGQVSKRSIWQAARS